VRGSSKPATAAHAATTVETSAATFSSLTSGLVSGNFSGIPTPNPFLSGFYGAFNPLLGFSALRGVSFSTTNQGGAVDVNSAGTYGSSDLQVPYAINSVYSDSSTTPSVLTITLPSPETAFALDFGTVFASTTATFALSDGFMYLASDTPVATNGDTEFLGFLSSTPFDVITVTTPAQTGLQAGWVVADFAYGAALTTPEPSTWAMMLIGFAGLGFAGYRASRNGVALER
jgi:PEP-CTERM motif